MKAQATIAAALFVGLLVSAVGAATPWESKPFNTWTAEELKLLLGNSPWSGKGSITRVKSNGGTSQPIEETVVISWNTALPMREALIREQIGLNGAVTPAIENFLAQQPNAYVIAVKIAGGNNATSYARQANAALKETMIEVEGRAPIQAQIVEARMVDKEGKVIETPAPGAKPAPGAPGGGFGGGAGRGAAGGSTVMVFAFPKSITADDKEVEFVTRVSNYYIKKKFKMKDMLYKGELAL